MIKQFLARRRKVRSIHGRAENEASDRLLVQKISHRMIKATPREKKEEAMQLAWGDVVFVGNS